MQNIARALASAHRPPTLGPRPLEALLAGIPASAPATNRAVDALTAPTRHVTVEEPHAGSFPYEHMDNPYTKLRYANQQHIHSEQDLAVARQIAAVQDAISYLLSGTAHNGKYRQRSSGVTRGG